MQLNVGHLDENGVYTGSYTTFAFAGSVRAMVSLASWPLQLCVQAFHILARWHGCCISCPLLATYRRVLLVMPDCCVQGASDSGLDHLWRKKAAEVGQDLE